jgi:predicted phosphodiesterase
VLGVLYDVHGNLPALEAVLEDAVDAGADRWLLGGDYALFGGWPAETVERLHALERAIWIRGNGERWTAEPGAAPDNEVVPGAVAAARAALGDELVRDLGSLPFDAELDDGALAVHGSPASDVRSFPPSPGVDDGELLAGVKAWRLIFGHTHVPFVRKAGPVELLNPGSVGMPFDGDPRASYALIGADGRIELRRVEYDYAGSAGKVRSFGERWAEVVGDRIERARMDI